MVEIDNPTIGEWIGPGLVSNDGLVVAGSIFLPDLTSAPFRWTATSGTRILEGIQYIAGMSADGLRIAGTSLSGELWRPWMWTPAGVTPIAVPPGWAHCSVTHLTPGAETLVGVEYEIPYTTTRPFRWRLAQGPEFLDEWAPGLQVIPRFASADAEVIVGHGTSAPRWLIWSPHVQRLDAVLSAAGLADPQTYFWQCLGSSGRLIVGYQDSDVVMVRIPGTALCYANCDASTAPPALGAADFACFLNRFAAGEAYANCDRSTSAPSLTVSDFVCFINAYAAGCS